MPYFAILVFRVVFEIPSFLAVDLMLHAFRSSASRRSLASTSSRVVL